MSFSSISSSLFILFLSVNSNAEDLIANLNYGDNRSTVTRKLTVSKLAEATIEDGLFGRTGLNGTFTTTREIAGLSFQLYFDWTEADGLKDVTFRSEPLSSSNYDRRLMRTWEYTVNLLSSLYGKATNAGYYPKRHEIEADKVQYSHEWQTNEGYVYLGIGEGSEGYSMSIKFRNEALPSTK